MTAKQEATELVDRFKQYSSGNVGGDSEKYTAKQCALICVDEMIKEHLKYTIEMSSDRYKELEEVKNELNKRNYGRK